MLSTTGRKVTVVKLDHPARCVQAGGINGGNTSQYYVEATVSEQQSVSNSQ